MKRTRILGLLIAIAVLGGLATIGRADTGQTIRIPGHVLPAIARATVVASKPNRGAQPITLTVVLKRDDQAAFERYLKDHYDPHSPNFHHFLTQPQIAGRFGPSRDDYGAVLAYLHGNGLRLVAGSKNRLTLTVRGSRVQAERAFGIQINDYALGKRTFYANDRDPAMPGELAPRVSAVVGLSNLARPQHSTKVIHALFCRAAKLLCRIANPEKEGEPVIKGCYDPDSGGGATNAKTIDCGEIKEFSPPERALSGGEQFATGPRPTNSAVPWSSADGTGQTIGLVEFDTFNQSDVVNFLAYFGHPAGVINQLSQIAVSGGVASPGVDQDEVLIDVDTTLSLAPGASTVVYDAPFSGAGSFQAVFNQMIENKVTIISNSWAYCEDETTLADAQSVDLILQNAAAAGISVFNGTGDSGSTCLDGSTNTIPVPADSPNATAVGGSSENSGPSFTYGPETW